MLEVKLGGVMEIYRKFVGDDPAKVPMRIFPAVHYSMGGLWVDNEHGMTNIPGLFAAGEADYQYHGANRLGANSLLSCIYTGLHVVGPSATEYAKDAARSSGSVPSSVFDAELKRQNENNDWLKRANGKENPYVLHRELGQIMTNNVTVVRYNDKLRETDTKIQELMARYRNIAVPDKSEWSNQPLLFSRQLWNMLVLARVITLGALRRDESRGAHYKPDFPKRNDAQWLKTTLAHFAGPTEAPEFSYQAVDISLLPPRSRDYSGKAKQAETAPPAAPPVTAGAPAGNGNTATVTVAPAGNGAGNGAAAAAAGEKVESGRD
jgi:succinate dehydrogenase / fumarate reductase flavoprotein subunit